MEYEAELTKNIVCQILGIGLKDECYYLTEYKNKDGTEPNINYNEMIKAVDKILGILPLEITNKAITDNFSDQMSIF